MTAPNQLPLSSSTPEHSRPANPCANKCYKTWPLTNEEREGCGGSDRDSPPPTRGLAAHSSCSSDLKAQEQPLPLLDALPIPCTGSPSPCVDVNTSKSTHCHGNKQLLECLQGSWQCCFHRDAVIRQLQVTWTQGLPLIRGVKHFQVFRIGVILCHCLLPTVIFCVTLFYFCKGKLLLERRDSAH